MLNFLDCFLRDTCVRPLTARFLLQSYVMQRLCVKWSSSVTESFSVTNGVKQGGVLSPLLFAIYMDELLTRIKAAGVGCRIGNTFTGALAYADDLLLLAPTRHALQHMLSICERFSADANVKFNPEKSSLLIFGEQPTAAFTLTLNGKTIPRVTTDKHLGNMFGPGTADQKISVTTAVNDMYARTNLLMALFGNCTSAVKYSLFKSFCVVAYGSQLWDLSSRVTELFYVAWRKCVRRILDLPRTTHCQLLPLICQD